MAWYLKTEQSINPLKFGFIASTDTHLGTPGAVDESSFSRSVVVLVNHLDHQSLKAYQMILSLILVA